MREIQPSFDKEFGIKISELQYNLNQCLKAISHAQDNQNVQVAVLVGSTGAGKSTVLNQLAGIVYKSHEKEDTGVVILQPDNNKELAGVGHSAKSMTLFPQVYYDPKTKIAYCDTPGYAENREGVAGLCSSFGIPLIINQSKVIKGVIAVVDWPTVLTARGAILADVFSEIGQLFQSSETVNQDDVRSLENSIFFVFTKVKPGFKRSQVAAQLREFLEAETQNGKLEALLDKQKYLRQKLSNAKTSDEQRELREELIKHDKLITRLRGKIRMLLLLQAKPQHIFLHDTEGGTSEIIKMQELICSSTPIPRNQMLPLNFEHPLIEKIATKAIELFEKRIRILKNMTNEENEIKNLNGRLKNCDEEIARLEAQKKNKAFTTDQRKKESGSAKAQLGDLKERKESIQNQLKELNREQELINEEIKRLNTNEEALHYSKQVQVKPHVIVNAYDRASGAAGKLFDRFVAIPFLGMELGDIVTKSIGDGLRNFLKDEGKIEYNDIPFTKVKKSTALGTVFNNDEFSIPEQGLYSISYAPDSASGWAEVQIFAAKREIHKKRIQALIQNLKELSQNISRLKDDLQELNLSEGRWNLLLLELEEQQKLDYDHIMSCFQKDGEIIKLQRENLLKLKAERNNDLTKINEELISNRPWFEFLLQLSRKLPFDSNSTVLEFLKLLSTDTFGKTLVELKDFYLQAKGDKNGELRYIKREKGLIGKMPDNITKEFEEFEALGDGACGFHVLGISRKELVDLLLPLANVESIRNELSIEILNALKTNDLQEASTVKSKELYSLHCKYRDELPELEKAANALIKQTEPETSYVGGLDKLRAHLKANLNKSKEYEGMLNKLETYLKEVQACEQEMSKYCCSEEIYVRYVTSLGKTGWMGHKSAKLVAKLKHINLYIWSKNNNNPERLELIDSHVEEGLCPTIHMLYKPSPGHFDLLAEKADDDSVFVEEPRASTNEKLPAVNNKFTLFGQSKTASSSSASTAVNLDTPSQETLKSILLHKNVEKTPNNNSTITIVFDNLEHAKQFQADLHKVGIRNTAMPEQARKIEIVQRSGVDGFTITLSLDEYNAIMGEGAYEKLVSDYASKHSVSCS